MLPACLIWERKIVWHISPERLPSPALIYAALELAKKIGEKKSNTRLDSPSVIIPLPSHLSLSVHRSSYLELIKTSSHERSGRNQESGNATQKWVYAGARTLCNAEITSSGDCARAWFTIPLDASTKYDKNLALEAAPQYTLLCLTQL